MQVADVGENLKDFKSFPNRPLKVVSSGPSFGHLEDIQCSDGPHWSSRVCVSLPDDSVMVFPHVSVTDSVVTAADHTVATVENESIDLSHTFIRTYTCLIVSQTQ